MILPKGSILKVATLAAPTTKFALTEHNRAEVEVSFERIERSQRMANGRMRKFHIADKRTWTTSWDMVPHTSAKTVDNFWGGQDMEAFFKTTKGEFYLWLRLPNGTEEQVLVVFKDFSSRTQKRGVYEFWNVNMALEEV